jgi:hypothetical protein
MFNISEDSHEPRGFSGRPLIALLFAVGAGISAYYVGSWTHLQASLVFIIFAVAIVLVAYGWYWHSRAK